MRSANVTGDAGGDSRTQSPYVGLIPYDEGDAEFFFGRSSEAAIVAMNLRTARLTILYGPSGVGKSSLLMAGAVHGLREEARAAAAESPFSVCVFRSWREDPVRGVQEAARDALQAPGAAESASPPASTLAETLRRWTGAGTLLVVFDQFEEYFQYHTDEGNDERLFGFAAELARIVNDASLPVHVLLSIREDAWAKLDLFEGHVASLFANYVRVDHLDLDAAREAIEGPIEAWNRSLPEGEQPFEIEPALVEAVLAATAGGGLTLTAGSESPDVDGASDRVEAPFLQLVIDRLWRETVDAGERRLTVATLERLGGAARIVENHLLDALGRLAPTEQDAASDCFRFLVSRSKTKIAHPASDLAEWTQRPEAEVTAVLDKLCTGESGRILRAVAPAHDETSTSYELFHDILAEPILDWRRSHEAERSRRAARRRVLRIGSILVGLVAVFAALGVWALIQRNDARHTARVANSVLLASTAKGLLDSRLDRSLLLALTAHGFADTGQARDAMTLALERASTSGLAATFRGPAGGVTSVAFSREGKTLASGDADGTVRLWDVTMRGPLGRPLSGARGSVASVALNPDGETLAVGGADGKVRLWDLATRRPAGRPLIGSRKGSVRTVAISPDGKTLASGGDDGTVRLWGLSIRRSLRGALRGSRFGYVAQVAFSPDGKTLAAAGSDGTVLFDLTHRRPRARPLIGTDIAAGSSSVAFSRDGKTLADNNGGKVRLWDLATRRPLGPPLTRRRSGFVRSVAFSSHGNTLASDDDNGTVRLWDLSTRRPLDPPLAGTGGGVGGGSVSTVAFSPDLETLATGSDEGAVRLWALAARRRLGRPLTGFVQSVAFSPTLKTLASSGKEGGKVQLWDLATRKPLGPPATIGGSGRVWSLAFSSDGKTLASGGESGHVRWWDLTTRRPLDPLLTGTTGRVLCIAFSPDGTMLASGQGANVQLWEVDSRKRRGAPLPGSPGVQVRSVAYSPDGETLAVGDENGAVRLWDLAARKARGRPLTVPGTGASSLVFSPNGRTLANGGDDGRVRLWDLATRKLLGEPLPLSNSGSVSSVAFSPDGTTLAGASDDGKVRSWEDILWTDDANLRDQVCRLVSGNLSQDEWRDLAPPGLAYRADCPG